MKFTSLAFAALVAVFGLSSPGDAAAQAAAPQAKAKAAAKPKAIADIHKNRKALAGQIIQAQGQVIKANNGIKGFNFVHIQDGTGAAGSNTLIVRSKDTANVGDKVTISGVVVVDRDFGSGYFYPLLIEEATITPRM